MLDLVRLSPRLLFPPGDVDLYRQIALLTDMDDGAEVLDVACGKGVPLEYFVREYGVHGSGIDVDGRLVEEAEDRARASGLAEHLQFQTGPSDVLPYRDEIFDVTVGELGLAAHCDPMDAVSELVRVTKPGGHIVLVQLVWKAPVDEPRQRILTEHLGARPLMLVEWKRRLKECGVEELHTEDWTDEETAFRARSVKPFPDFAEIFSLGEKIGILRRAWSRWGWTGVRTVLEREREIHRLLNRDRVLGLDLLKGRRPRGEDVEEEPEPEGRPEDLPESPPEPEPDGTERAEAVPGQADGAEVAPDEAERVEVSPDEAERVEVSPDEDDELGADGDPETAGLPLFGGDSDKA
jgi:ubiquinone/menaquinone biosynthesis C-methylase UbiE